MESFPSIAAVLRSTIKEIMETHIPDGREIDVKSILQIVEDIFNSATPTITEDTSKEVSGEASRQADVAASVFEQFTYIVNQLSSEISYKCMIGAEEHSTTISLFRMLSSYSWDAKLVLTLAAFALIYGEFLLHSQVYSSSTLVRRMAILKQSPGMTESSVKLNTLIDAQNNLIQSILDLVKCIITFKELPTGFLSQDNAAFSVDITIIPTASYWIIRSVIVCATNITYRSGTGLEYAISKPEDRINEVAMLNNEIKTMYNYLQNQLNICHHNIEERKHHEAYGALLHSLENDYVDNMRSLKLLICPKNDPQPLFDRSTNKPVGIEVVKGKTVLLLIAYAGSILEKELLTLEQIYKESRMHTRRVESQYDVIWIPMVNPSTPWTEETQKDIESTQMRMPWLSLCHPELIDQVVLRFIKENLQFKDKPVLTVIDPLGKILNFDALSMMCIWGSHGFPFSTAREKALWKEATWGLELLVGDIFADLATWISQEKHIFLYGGNDIDWVAKFKLNASRVAKTARIPLEMIYVGGKYELESMASWIKSENFGQTWLDFEATNLFWTRLENMVNSISSMNKLRNNAAEQDQSVLLQEIKKLVENGTSGSAWAVYSKGENIAINGSGTIVLSALLEYENWKKDVEAKGFHVAFKEYYDKLYDAAYPGYAIEFPATTDQHVKIPEKMDCPKCNYIMQKYVNFSCSHSQSENP